jgi:hypothetical protein
MKNAVKGKFFVLLISLIAIGAIVSPVCMGATETANKEQISLIKEKMNNQVVNKGTEYWALLVAVGVYYNHPEQDRPTMLNAVDDLYDSLMASSNWQADHIHMLKASQATTLNLIKELIWLIQNEDNDDISLVYITTHGSPLRTKNGLPIDLPPKDEADGEDEALIMYYGFERTDFITDDLLNFFLDRLQSTGVCVIVDSCYSGGFNDPPMLDVSTSTYYTSSITALNKNCITNKYAGYQNTRNNVEQITNRINIEPHLTTSQTNIVTTNKVNHLETEYNNEQLSSKVITKSYTAESFVQGFIEELAGQGRVVLMSCEEEEMSYGSDFSNTLIDGFNGWADLMGNQDGINSAEEAFYFAKPIVIILSGGAQTPTILDLYPGELQVTYN